MQYSPSERSKRKHKKMTGEKFARVQSNNSTHDIPDDDFYLQFGLPSLLLFHYRPKAMSSFAGILCPSFSVMIEKERQ